MNPWGGENNPVSFEGGGLTLQVPHDSSVGKLCLETEDPAVCHAAPSLISMDPCSLTTSNYLPRLPLRLYLCTYQETSARTLPFPHLCLA